jgi:dTDP-4-dehydrorhamnose 3,5-epimerase-like enzyme
VPDQLKFMPLTESTDARGLSFSITPTELRALPNINDVHIAAIAPGTIRGNHYHLAKIELITVVYKDEWSFHWDTGPESSIQCKKFLGEGAVSVSVPQGWSHAVRNDGSLDMWIFVASDKFYNREGKNPEFRDAYPRVVTGLHSEVAR